jgi:hypothetical protein
VRRIALIALVLIAGCGGGDEEEPLTAAQWVSRADAACERAASAIAERGWADDLRELHAHARTAQADVQTATAEIRRLPVPPGKADHARSVVTAARDLEPLLDDIARADDETGLDELASAADTLRLRLLTVSYAARRAGLHSCLQHHEAEWLSDGIRAPVAVEQIARANLRLAERVETTSVGVALDEAAKRIDAIDPPDWVHVDVWRYRDALRDLADISRQKRSRPAVSAALRRAGRLCNRIMRRIGADPISEP